MIKRVHSIWHGIQQGNYQENNRGNKEEKKFFFTRLNDLIMVLCNGITSFDIYKTMNTLHGISTCVMYFLSS